MKHILAASAAGTLLLMAAACSNNSWHVEGTVAGATDKPMLVQASENGHWYTLDTIVPGRGGKFSYAHPAMGRPDVYRLTLDGRSIYFPVDSIETVTVEANDSTFDTSYTIAGTDAAASMMEVDRLIREAGASALTDAQLKRKLAEMMLADPSGIVAYYIISKRVNGEMLFNPAVRSDNRVIGAVANAYSEKRPSDPRTSMLKTLYLANRAMINPASVAPADTIQATELAYFDIALTNEKGQKFTLSDAVKRNKVVVLSFTAYTAEGSPAYNALLAEAYRAYHGQGMEIYQVALDDDEFQWKKSAKNLPWITVYHPATIGAELLRSYNVQGLPTTFVIANGTITDRVTNPKTITATVGRHM